MAPYSDAQGKPPGEVIMDRSLSGETLLDERNKVGYVEWL
jgi:hypothetical protein